MQQVLDAERAVMADFLMGAAAPGFPSGFWPVIDGDFVPAHVHDPVTAPANADVPVMLGQTGTEFTLFMLQDQGAYTLDDAGLEARVTRMLSEDAPWVLDSYRRDFPDYVPSALYFRIYSDFAMGALSNSILDVRATTGAAPVYAYRFDWMTPIEGGRLFSPHTIEIPFAFDNATTEAGIIMTEGGDAVATLAKTVSEAWVQFAKTGTPAAPGLPEWPAYDPQARQAMHLNTQSHVAPYIDPRAFDLFKAKLWASAGLE
ncbi:Carboxylesterase family protein [Tropicibacter naphthalenivorans]|uniref:Para-nitrobenzyl esterase n=2 Tax=Tropicibacter naphthalenivorans TaxID=441103 RepID=A0A0P1H0H4_9RHOB|nr:Para-nitrobenzyl esterase [Tropicibacter naphthalenivorans]SMC97533.1 Carboxylesterase family protein [Tropicibacter naphthalenivorans]